MTDTPALDPTPRRRPGTLGLLLLAAVVVAALTWAKWQPYGHKLAALWSDRVWTGTAIIDRAGSAAAAPSWHGAWAFTTSYLESVWPALVAALVIAASVDALLPAGFPRALLGRRTAVRGAMAGGFLAMPCMMCTCCAAPITYTLRRRGVSTAAALAYWFGNPAINPVVLVFLALVAPWQWAATRALAGAVLVFGVSVLVARLAGRHRDAAAAGLDSGAAAPASPGSRDASPANPGTAPASPGTALAVGGPADRPGLRQAPNRFARNLLRLAVTLVPEYLLVVFAVGALRGWLFPLGAGAAHWGVLAAVVAAVAGTLMVVPTGGEIPIVLGLAAAGLGSAPLGALLVTLPAISLPSMVMVAPALGWRATLGAAGGVIATGLAGAVLLTAMT